MQTLYAFDTTESDDLKKDEKFLLQSLDSMYELYLVILSFISKTFSYNPFLS